MVLTLSLVAVPGLAAAKFVALIATLTFGTLRGDFRCRGLVVGYLAMLTLSFAYAAALIHQVYQADRDAHLVRVFSFYAAFACITYVREGFKTTYSIDNSCIAAAVIMALFKIAILLAVDLFGYSLPDALEWLGFESVTLKISESIFRLQFPSDFIVLFLLACYTGRKSVFTDVLFISAIGVVVFLSFSRFIFLCFFIGLLVRAIWIRKVDLITVISAGILLVAIFSFSDVLIERFVGEGSNVSDEIRVEQIQELTREIQYNPIFGSGLGSSVPNFVRSETLPYSYEIQWYATVMQFGFFGTTILIISVLLMILWGIRGARAIVCLSLLIAMWIVAGFTNPFITSLGSAVGLSLARRRAQVQQ